MSRILLTQQKERPICQHCSVNQCKGNGVTKFGIIKYSKYCNPCQKAIYNLKNDSGTRRFGYVLHKKDKCDTCGFIPENKCQLDVDHIDGDSGNNNISNLQILCANCHRLKTYFQRNKKP